MLKSVRHPRLQERGWHKNNNLDIDNDYSRPDWHSRRVRLCYRAHPEDNSRYWYASERKHYNAIYIEDFGDSTYHVKKKMRYAWKAASSGLVGSEAYLDSERYFRHEFRDQWD